MKKNLISLLSFACAMCLFTACEEDDDTPFSVPAEPVTFKSGEGLNFTSAGNPVDNAQVTYMPDATDNLKGELIVALLDAARSEAMEILPGSTSVTLPVTMEKGLDNATFSGNSETDYCTFKYDGTFSKLGISLNFSDVTKKEGIDIPGHNMTYTDANGLRLSYNGNPLLGKKVTVMTEPGTETATIVLSGETLDLSQLAGMLPASKAGQRFKQPGLEDILNIPTCGVIPGSISETLTVNLNADKEFNGEAETDFVTYKYAGKIADNGLEFKITDATLKNAALAGTTWEIYNEPNDWYDPNDPDMGGPVNYNGIHINWKSDKNASIDLGFGSPTEFSPGEFLTLALAFIIIEGPDGTPANLSTLLGMALQNVTFHADGNITATYLDTANGGYKQAPANIAQYVVTGDGTLRFFLNPSAVIANVIGQASKSRSIDTMSLLMNVAQTVVPCLVEGFPIVYGNDATGYYPEMKYFALGTDFLKPLLCTLAPIFSDEEFIQSIMEVVSSDPTFGSMAPMMEPVLRDLPEIIEKTTVIEIGINVKEVL